MAKSTSDNIRIRASVAASRANNEAGTIQDDSPELTGKASASMPVFNLAAYLASEIQYISERSYNWNNMLYKVPDETLANVTVTMPDVFTKGLRAQLRISNVFDRDIQHPASNEMNVPTIPQNGRNMTATLVYVY